MPSASKYSHHAGPGVLGVGFGFLREHAEHVQRLELSVDGAARFVQPPVDLSGRRPWWVRRHVVDDG